MNLVAEEVILSDAMQANASSSADSIVNENCSAAVMSAQKVDAHLASKSSNTLSDTQTVDKHQVADHFSAASGNYDLYAQVQKQIAEVNLELLQQSSLSNAKQVVDLGCGTGIHTKSLAALSESCLAIDISHGMLTAARANNSNTKTAQDNAIQYCNGDADNLPLRSGSIDVLHSSMALQWCSSPESATSEFVRVLSNSGSAQVAIMLDSSLGELKSAWRSIGLEPRVNEFFGLEQWLQAAQNAVSKQQTVVENTAALANTNIRIKHQVQSFVEWHPSSLHMLRALKRIGAATKSEFAGSEADSETEEQIEGHANNAQECLAPLSKPISKQELKMLDKEMRKQLTDAALKNACANTRKNPVKTLPLTYQVLFLSIQKNTMSEAE